MKKLLTILCLFSIVAILSACNNGDSGGKGSTIPEVSYGFNNNVVMCYNASSSVITEPTQTCTWNCATYQGSKPQSYIITFENGAVKSTHKGPCKL